MKKTSHLFKIIAVLFAVFISSCSVNKWALNKVAKALTGDGGTVFSGDEDPKLVGDAMPFALKTYESLLASLPDNDDLLLATGSAFCMYSYAYVQYPADMLPSNKIRKKNVELARAKKLYLRSRKYLLKALEVRHPGFNALLDSGQVDKAVSMTTQKDTSLLYWTCLSWMGAFTTNKFDLKLAVSVKKAIKLMDRVMELNESFGDGSAHEFYISYLGNLPKSMGGSKKKAREHFEKAVKLSKGNKASVYMALATSVCIPEQNIVEFRKLMKTILKINIEASPKNRLSNVLTKKKAKWYLAHLDDYFLVDDTK